MFSPVSRVIGNACSSFPTAETIKASSTKIVALIAIASVAYLYIKNKIVDEAKAEIREEMINTFNAIKNVFEAQSKENNQLRLAAKQQADIANKMVNVLNEMRSDLDMHSTLIMRNNAQSSPIRQRNDQQLRVQNFNTPALEVATRNQTQPHFLHTPITSTNEVQSDRPCQLLLPQPVPHRSVVQEPLNINTLSGTSDCFIQ